MKTIIGVSGYAGSGKDTFAQLAMSLIGRDRCRRIALADPIKETVNSLMGWGHEHAFGKLKEVEDPFWGFSPRHAYQTFGTEWARVCLRQDFWTQKLLHTINESDREIFFVPDVRFENEYEWLRTLDSQPDFSTIHIHIVDPLLDATGDMYSHASEAFVGELRNRADYVVINDKRSGVEGFVTTVETTMKELGLYNG